MTSPKNQRLSADRREAIERLAQSVRIKTTEMISRARSSHIGGNFSMAEIVAVLYDEILNITPKHLDAPDRDRFILSKGHAAAAYYSILALKGFFPMDWLDTFYLNGGHLAGHATRSVPGVEVSSGSLGHGLPMAVGMAKAAKIDQRPYRVFALLSDGECQEGSVWEAAMLAAHHRLDNLTVIVDYNKIQALGQTSEICDLEPFAEKWNAFGWTVRQVDGHSVDELYGALSALPFTDEKPSCVIAHTVKGKGVSFMEDKLLWHYRTPVGEEFDAAMSELCSLPHLNR
ncbi:MAG: transketolase [Thermoguttaceae bacterium]|nr:transketolase [Thermoguttaceae bacterium]